MKGRKMEGDAQKVTQSGRNFSQKFIFVQEKN